MHVPRVIPNRKHTMALSSSLYGSRYSRIGLVVLGMGVVFHVIGYSVPDWQKFETDTGNFRVGLWKQCGLEGCITVLEEAESWFLAVRILETLSVVVEIGALVGVAGYMYRGSHVAAYLTAVSCLTAGLSTLIGTVIYWADHDQDADLYWGFAFEVIGALNCLSAGGIFVYEGKTQTGYVSIR